MRVSTAVKVIGVVILGVCSSQFAWVLPTRGHAAAAGLPDDEQLRDDDRKVVSNAQGGIQRLLPQRR